MTPLGRAIHRLLRAPGLPALALMATGCHPAGRTVPAATEVFIVGTLYSRHNTVSAYSLDSVRAIMRAIDPEVLVLDVTPTELAEQRVWPGKVEYTGVIFPFLNERRLPVYAAEPAEPLFTEISGTATGLRRDFERRDPEGMSALSRLRTATYAAMFQTWTGPADAHSEATERTLRGLKQHEVRAFGPLEEDSQQRWDRHAADVVRQAAREHPGRRILVLTGIENRLNIVAYLAGEAGIRVVDVERWMRSR